MGAPRSSAKLCSDPIRVLISDFASVPPYAFISPDRHENVTRNFRLNVALTIADKLGIILSKYQSQDMEVCAMKSTVCVDAINNAWARLVFDEPQEREMEVHLGTLYQYIKDEIRPGEFLEITLGEEQQTITAARKLVEETEKRWKEAIAQHNRLIYGTSRGQNV
jgi:flagellin-specific chaperone FliS